MKNDMDENLYENMQAAILHKTFYRGIPTYKNPLDAWIYQQIIYQNKPEIIIEIGSKFGGSALYFSDLLGMIVGRVNTAVISVDIAYNVLFSVKNNPQNIEFIQGDATQEATKNAVLAICNKFYSPKIMLIEDSAHTKETTLKIMELYKEIVTVGQFMVIEDTIIGHGLKRAGYGGQGPAEAVEEFLKSNDGYMPDGSFDQYPISWNKGGCLRRVS